MLHVIATGGKGQLGLALAAEAAGRENLCFVNPGRDVLDINQDSESLQRGIESLLSNSSFDQRNDKLIFINCAAYTVVDKAEEDREEAFALNAFAPLKLASFIADLDYAGMIQISSDYVFDGEKNRPYTEQDLPAPRSVYGASKLEGEKGVAALASVGRALVVRTSWLYSPYRSNFVLNMLRLASERDELGVVVDQIGSPTYAPHLAKSLLDIAMVFNRDVKFRVPLLHHSDLGVASWYDLAAYALSFRPSPQHPCILRPISTEEYPTAAIRPAYSVLSNSLLYDAYGIRPSHWTLGVRELLCERS